MKKNRIRLTESQLNRVINEELFKILKTEPQTLTNLKHNFYAIDRAMEDCLDNLEQYESAIKPIADKKTFNYFVKLYNEYAKNMSNLLNTMNTMEDVINEIEYYRDRHKNGL